MVPVFESRSEPDQSNLRIKDNQLADVRIFEPPSQIWPISPFGVSFRVIIVGVTVPWQFWHVFMLPGAKKYIPTWNFQIPDSASEDSANHLPDTSNLRRLSKSSWNHWKNINFTHFLNYCSLETLFWVSTTAAPTLTLRTRLFLIIMTNYKHFILAPNRA